jgi:glutamate carboxypeptidase
MTTASAAEWLTGLEPSMLEQIARLARQNSFTENREGGNRVGAMLRELFAIEGLAASKHASEKFADHLVFKSVGDQSLAPIALIGHLDTVFPPGAFEGFMRDDDVVRGPGVLDMKGGLVVVAFALRAIAATRGLRGICPLRLIIVADEEVGSPEGKGVIEREVAGSRAALVFEAGRKNDMIVTKRRGTGGITVTAFGKAAHAGNAHKEGANAIWALSRFVDIAQRFTNYERGITVNVGKFTGGHGKNTVPDHAEALVDIRFNTRADGDFLVDQLSRAATEATAELPGTSIDLSGGIARLPLERTDDSEGLVMEYGACARASGLGASESPLVGGGSDACTTGAMGIPSIDGLGPRGTGFHTKEELIEVSSLVPKAQALARFLERA